MKSSNPSARGKDQGGTVSAKEATDFDQVQILGDLLAAVSNLKINLIQYKHPKQG